MSLNENRTARFGQSMHWQDWANIVLAVWLFISPWVINFAGGPAGAAPVAATGVAATASWNAWIIGVIIFLVAIAAVARLQVWQEWVNLVLGIWLFISPWVLGFSGLAGAAWNHWIVGALVAILAAWELQAARSASTSAAPGYAGDKPGRRD
jgi:hypothetical protein